LNKLEACDNRAIAFPPTALIFAPHQPSETDNDRKPMIESPCVKVCTLDARSGLCLGCGRSVDEIARWSAMSAAERARVMRELPSRNSGAAVAATG
jgi:predicted Fe-S protein YdhL (DUF1289 family)